MIYLKIKNNEVLANAFEITEPDLVISNQEWIDCGCHAYIADNEIVLGYPAPTREEIEKARIAYRHEHIDDETLCRLRKQANGTWTEEDETAYLALDAEVTAYIEENLPYPTDPIYEE